MKSRERFLRHLFTLLDERGVPWCLLRNFDTVFDAIDSDVDLLVEPGRLEDLRRAACDTALETGHQRVQFVQFVNASWVFWDGDEGYVRIDVDTEIRWRIFPVLDALDILRARKRVNAVWIPSPEHEVTILRAQIAWRGDIPEHYRRRFSELNAEAAPPAAERREIIRKIARSPAAWGGVAQFAVEDVGRWIGRWQNPPGVLLDVIAVGDFDAGTWVTSLHALFPPSKTRIVRDDAEARALLFKGGLAIRMTRAESDAGLSERTFGGRWPVGGGQARDSRRFAVLADSSGRAYAAHFGTGLMCEPESSHEFAQFVACCLARAENGAPAGRKGRTIVLAGLDGAGKTTFARRLSQMVATQREFAGIRYFHFIPDIGKHGFPWPSYRDTPRKGPTKTGVLDRFSSRLRLWRNVRRARAAMRGPVEALKRAGRLVLIDRYLLNYWLDPDSMRFVPDEEALRRALVQIPKADGLIVLDTDTAILTARKQELSLDEIVVQKERLRVLPTIEANKLVLDASQPPDALARQALEWIALLP